MIASRVGILGSLVAVLVLTAELAGGVALKHRLAADDTARLRGERDAHEALEHAITYRKGIGEDSRIEWERYRPGY